MLKFADKSKLLEEDENFVSASSLWFISYKDFSQRREKTYFSVYTVIKEVKLTPETLHLREKHFFNDSTYVSTIF